MKKNEDGRIMTNRRNKFVALKITNMKKTIEFKY